MTKKLVPIIILAAILAGCSDDPADPDDGAPELPTSADDLVTAFAAAYEAMDLEAYAFLLHEDYIFDPVAEGGYWDFLPEWDRAFELGIADNMFSGAPGQNPDGSYRAPIQGITIHTLLRQTEWAPVPVDDEHYTDAIYALFDAGLVFTLDGGENTMSVFYDQELYVRAIDESRTKVDDVVRYQMAGHREIRSSDKGNEHNSWSVIKSLYMPAEE